MANGSKRPPARACACAPAPLLPPPPKKNAQKSTWKVLPRSIQMHIVKEMGDDVFWERLLQVSETLCACVCVRMCMFLFGPRDAEVTSAASPIRGFQRNVITVRLVLVFGFVLLRHPNNTFVAMPLPFSTRRSRITPPYKPQDKSMEKTNVKIDWNKFVDEDEDEVGGELGKVQHTRKRCTVKDVGIKVRV